MIIISDVCLDHLSQPSQDHPFAVVAGEVGGAKAIELLGRQIPFDCLRSAS
jgi:hypothetical protein